MGRYSTVTSEVITHAVPLPVHRDGERVGQVKAGLRFTLPRLEDEPMGPPFHEYFHQEAGAPPADAWGPMLAATVKTLAFDDRWDETRALSNLHGDHLGKWCIQSGATRLVHTSRPRFPRT